MDYLETEIRRKGFTDHLKKEAELDLKAHKLFHDKQVEVGLFVGMIWNKTLSQNVSKKGRYWSLSTYLWNLLWANTFYRILLHPFPWVLCRLVVFLDISQATLHEELLQMHRQHQPQTELWSLDCIQSIHRFCSRENTSCRKTDPKISSRLHHLQREILLMMTSKEMKCLILQVFSCSSTSSC